MKHPVWHSYHLFYHGSRSRLIAEVVRPAVGDLLQQGHIEDFFFVRYNLGGPHVRLRLQAPADSASSIRETLTSVAQSFFARHPSASPVPEDEIRRVNRTIVATDPIERDDAVYPDHSLQESPFRPETDRYGGPELLGSSLTYFVFSSLEALRFLADHSDSPRGRQMAEISRILVRQALGFSGFSEEFFSLLEYPMETWGTPLSHCVARADEAFLRQRDSLMELLRDEVSRFLAQPMPPTFEPACRFRREIRMADKKALRCIKSSQMHMTANRLGLSNPEEVYLSRLLSLAARDLVDSDRDLWCTRSSGDPRACLRDLLPSALATVFPELQQDHE